MLASEYGKGGAREPIDKQSPYRGEKHVPREAPGGGQAPDDPRKDEDRNVWRLIPRVNPREDSRKVASLPQRKRQARRMQQLCGQIAVNGNERPGGNQRCPGCSRKLPRGSCQRTIRHGCAGEHGVDNVLNCAKQESYRNECHKKGKRSVAPRILC